jgi:hypothetical protein
MSQDHIALARRLMTLLVPAAGGDAGTTRMHVVSFCLLECGPSGMVFRLVDGDGKTLDLCLNPVVVDALHDCLALRDRLLGAEPDGVGATPPQGDAG